MFGENGWRRLRGVVRNALVWGAGWSTFSFGMFTILRLFGVFPSATWVQGLGLAARFGIVGAVAGGAFSTVIGFLYRGRRLREISWVRFGIAGALITGVFVPLFLQAMNLISGDGLVPWRLVLDDALWTAVFGGVVAGGSLKLAQRADALAGRSDGRLTAVEKKDS
ncbi:MAG TPA: hypothetical protein VJO33_15200 [Gemmatimonadaceae bacterium]|nr:hypothetical protein [Gemmatimonadaceae bacterium]